MSYGFTTVNPESSKFTADRNFYWNKQKKCKIFLYQHFEIVTELLTIKNIEDNMKMRLENIKIL